jgi:hypothetical protein
MQPNDWTRAFIVRGDALAWTLVNDVVKQAAYRIFDIFDSWRPGLLAGKLRWK